jgi:hypothetical protein
MAICNVEERIIAINKRKIITFNSTEDYENLNIISSNFMHRHNICLTADYSEEIG